MFVYTDVLDNDTKSEKEISLKKYRTRYNLLADLPGELVLVVKTMLGIYWLYRRQRIYFIKYYRVSMTYILHTMSFLILHLLYLEWSTE